MRLEDLQLQKERLGEEFAESRERDGSGIRAGREAWLWFEDGGD
jgi:hypothetical protein